MTRKPCHGCGQKIWREADSLCRDCKEILKNAKVIIKANEIENERNKNIVFIRTRYIPYFHVGFSYRLGALKEITPALHNLIMLVTKPIRERMSKSKEARLYPIEYDEYYWQADGVGKISKVFQEQFLKTFEILQRAIFQSYKIGLQEGSSILNKLRTGEIMNDDYEIKTFRALTLDEEKVYQAMSIKKWYTQQGFEFSLYHNELDMLCKKGYANRRFNAKKKLFEYQKILR